MITIINYLGMTPNKVIKCLFELSRVDTTISKRKRGREGGVSEQQKPNEHNIISYLIDVIVWVRIDFSRTVVGDLQQSSTTVFLKTTLTQTIMPNK